MERALTAPQLKFAEGVASGLSASAAYRAAYPKSSVKAARVSACTLITKPNVQAEIKRIRTAAAELVNLPLTIAEKRSFAARVVRAKISELTEDSDLWQEISYTEHGVKRKMPDKLRAIQVDNDLAAEGSAAGAADALTAALAKIVGKRPNPLALA